MECERCHLGIAVNKSDDETCRPTHDCVALSVEESSSETKDTRRTSCREPEARTREFAISCSKRGDPTARNGQESS